MKSFTWIKIVLCAIIASSAITSFSQVLSFPVTSSQIDPASDGFIYCLPKHQVRIDVVLKKTERFKGKYSDYATKLLGITDFINKDAVAYSIDDIKINTDAIADSTQVYYAQLPAKMDDQSIKFVLTEEGLISGYHIVNDDKKVDHKNSQDTPFRDLLKPVLIEKVDTIIRRVSIDTSIFEEKVLKRSISEKSVEQQAREIADLIYRIEDNKFSLITGYQEVNYSKESLQYMLSKLNIMEKEYLAFFKGSISESYETYSFYYTPGDNSENYLSSLFRFSTTEGIMDKSSQTGDAVSISIAPQNNFRAARTFENKRATAKRKGKGLYYRVPESVQIQIKLGNTVLAHEISFIAQMGILTFLPFSTLSNAEFHHNGSLKSVVLE